MIIRSIFRWKNCTRTEALLQFSREKSNELTDQQDLFYYKTFKKPIEVTKWIKWIVSLLA